ncbi:MAG: hypothetical protein AAB686_03190, partial [Patescibacteria group bacterium]
MDIQNPVGTQGPVNMQNPNKKYFVIAGVAVLAVILIVMWFGGLFSRPGGGERPDPDTNLMSSRDAGDIALARAKEWDAGAKLAQMNSVVGQTGVTGRSDDWNFIFVSSQKKDKAFEVQIRNRAVASA